MSLRELDCRPILRKPWALGARGPDEFDCLGAAAWVALARGCPPEQVARMFPSGYASVEAAVREAVRRGPEHGWQRIGSAAGAASEVGDCVHSVELEELAGGRPQERHGVFSLVRAVAPKLALTSIRGRGVCIVPLSRIRGAFAVYRWAP